MFTGLIEEVGKIGSWESESSLHIQCSKVLDGVELGDSIAVNGVCLTVVKADKSGFWADVSRETRNRWCDQKIVPGALVNLERSLRMGAKLGGHFVLGHVDGKARVVRFEQEGQFHLLELELSSDCYNYLVPKGSLAVDGISLTINSVDACRCSLMIVPHTISNTNLQTCRVDDNVNIEADILGKYVERQLQGMVETSRESSINSELLSKFGYVSEE